MVKRQNTVLIFLPYEVWMCSCNEDSIVFFKSNSSSDNTGELKHALIYARRPKVFQDDSFF